MANSFKRCWWHEAVIYQVYPRSFKDTSNNGVGDLNGITEKLPHIKSLGVDAVWISPFFKSPMVDNGYDVSDYYAIDPTFGTMADFDRLMEECKRLKIKVIIDIVLNHTSNEHEWFKQALAGDQKKQRYYQFHDQPLNDWKSIFGGSAWTYVSEINKHYLHMFAVEQPDLDWNNGEMVSEMYDMMNFWIKKGVDGFRLDAIGLLGKDLANNSRDTRNVHDIIREIRRHTWKSDEFLTVGETGGSPERAMEYCAPHNEQFSQIFTFEHMDIDASYNAKWDVIPFNAEKLKEIFFRWQLALDGSTGWPTLYLENHDQARVVSRWGNDQAYWYQSATAFAVLLLTLRGTPYVYQGQEIGMTNVDWERIEDYNDVEIISSYRYYVEELKRISSSDYLAGVRHRGRDNARTPMQWSSEKNAGFSSADHPWLRVNRNFERINVSSQESNPHSILNVYRKLIKMRHDMKELLVYGSIEPLCEHASGAFCFKRFSGTDELYIFINLTEKEVDLGQKLLGRRLFDNFYEKDANSTSVLKPWQAIIMEQTV